MSTESSIINKPLNLRLLIMLALVIFFVGGIVVGYAMGGHQVHTNWQQYYDEECKEDLETNNTLYNLGEIKWGREN